MHKEHKQCFTYNDSSKTVYYGYGYTLEYPIFNCDTSRYITRKLNNIVNDLREEFTDQVTSFTEDMTPIEQVNPTAQVHELGPDYEELRIDVPFLNDHCIVLSANWHAHWAEALATNQHREEGGIYSLRTFKQIKLDDLFVRNYHTKLEQFLHCDSWISVNTGTEAEPKYEGKAVHVTLDVKEGPPPIYYPMYRKDTLVLFLNYPFFSSFYDHQGREHYQCRVCWQNFKIPMDSIAHILNPNGVLGEFALH